MTTRTRAAECGQKLQLFVPGEYPCVRRFRYRRLLTFLWLHGYGSTFVAMLKQTNTYFCVVHLARLVSQGQWTEALDYILPRFLPLEPSSTPSLEACVLVKFLRVHRLFQSEVASKFSRDWRPMWAKAAEIVGDLANRTPEFKDRLLLPDGLMGPQNVLPIGFGFAPFRRRRHVKKCTRPPSKHAREERSHRIANIYVDKRMSLPSSSHCSQEMSPETIAKARDDWFRRIFEECIKAAACLKLNHGCALQSSVREGASATGNPQPQIGDCPRPQTQSPVPNQQPSRMMTKTRAVVCGQERRSFVPGEYPCVSRLRYRWLLNFLRLQGYGSTFVAMLKQTNAYFCVSHLARFVSQGQWTEALYYIFPRFLPLEPCSPPSLEASVLVKFLCTHRLFQSEVASKISRDWRPMWARAAKIARDLANRTREFKGRPPAGTAGRPDGSAECTPHRLRLCSFPTEATRQEMYRSYHLPSSSHCSQELSPEILAKARDDWFEECFKPATCPEINQGCALQSSAREGASVASVCDAMFSDVINSTEKSGISSVAKTEECFKAATCSDINQGCALQSSAREGASVAPVCNAMFGNVINSTENSGISSVDKTGELVEHPHSFAN